MVAGIGYPIFIYWRMSSIIPVAVLRVGQHAQDAHCDLLWRATCVGHSSAHHAPWRSASEESERWLRKVNYILSSAYYHHHHHHHHHENAHFLHVDVFWFILRPRQHDDGYIGGRSQIKVHADERTQVHSAPSSLAARHPSTNRGRRCLTSVNVPLS